MYVFVILSSMGSTMLFFFLPRTLLYLCQNRFSSRDSFRNLVHFKTKEMCNKAVEKDPCLLAEVPDHTKTEEMCEKVVEESLWHLIDAPEEMCSKAVDKYPLLLVEVPDHLKTQEMCNKAVEKNSCLLVFVPGHLRTQEMRHEAVCN